MKKAILLLAIIFISVNSYAQSNEWKLMFDWKGTESKYSKYYNYGSLKYEGNVISVWIKDEPQDLIKRKTEKGEEKEIKSIQYLNRYYCGESLSSTIMIKYEFKDGTNETRPFPYTEKTGFLPDTYGEQEYYFFCFK